MRFREIWLQAHSGIGFTASFRFPFLGRLVVMKNLRAGRCELRMRERKIEVKRNRFRIKLHGAFIIFEQRVRVSRDLVGPQIENIGPFILRRLYRDACFLIGGKCHT